MDKSWIFIGLFVLVGALGQSTQKRKLCIVETFNSTRKQTEYCPVLADSKNSTVECIVGVDRLDCLKKIIIKKADFGIFEAEDLLVASNKKIKDVIVIGEIRFFEQETFDYDVVTVVRKNMHIRSLKDLRDQNLCHPGYGYERDWTEVISRYFEETVASQLCDKRLTSAENRIKSSADYFNEACKAGPWVPDKTLDAKLKSKYPNLCALCDNPGMCSTNDKYWGRGGPLYCLTDGIGDIAWARLNYVRRHFGLSPGSRSVAPLEEYGLLCPNGTTIPINSTEPCSWISKPWPVILTRMELSRAIQKLLTFKDIKYGTWEWALEYLISQHRETVVKTNVMTPTKYLQQVPGFLSANQRTHCNPLGKIRFCTSSNIENSKCLWLKEAAVTYGVEPELVCFQMDSDECLKAVEKDEVDLVAVTADQEYAARKYNLKPIVFETTKIFENFYVATAVVKADSNINKLEDLKGKKACFTSYGGVGWNTFIAALKKENLLSTSCPFAQAVEEFFSDSCVPGIKNSTKALSSNTENKLCALCSGEEINSGDKTTQTCSKHEDNIFSGETGAFRCLATGKGDVAFINHVTILRNTDGANNASWAINLRSSDFRTICGYNSSKYCHLGWASPGMIMMNSKATDMKKEEIFLALRDISKLFGHFHKAPTVPLQIFGTFDGEHNVLFKDVSEKFVDRDDLESRERTGLNYEEVLDTATCSSPIQFSINTPLVIVAITFVISRISHV